jgi:HemY protein
MRVGLFKITLAALIGGFLTWQLTKNNSYIQIVYGNYTLDISLWSLVLILSILFAVTLLLKIVIKAIIDPSQKLIKDFSEFKAKKNQSLVSRGFLYFIVGEWTNARKDLEKSAKDSPMPIVNYLAAAFSAHEAGDFEDADQLITKAQKNNTKKDTAVVLIKAKMYVRNKNYTKALEILKPLFKSYPSNSAILRELYTIYLSLEDLGNIKNLLPDLKRYKVFKKNKINEIEIYIYRSLIEIIPKNNATCTEDLNKFWSKIPRSLKKEKTIFLQYVTKLHEFREETAAESLIHSSLKSDWDEKLIRLYGLIAGPNNEKQLIFAESLLSARPNNPELLLALGRLNLRCELLVKAQDCFENSIAIQPKIETYIELARLMQLQHKYKESSLYYKQGLILAHNE